MRRGIDDDDGPRVLIRRVFDVGMSAVLRVRSRLPRPRRLLLRTVVLLRFANATLFRGSGQSDVSKTAVALVSRARANSRLFRRRRK